ncbi:hypothetical protein F5882DRAFT_4628 [Hyaloscypha sp. PMI_1271]|nr:hypothetical protein F5882DRAFT_4628 [Hyaloscypha sp. PMI_1271]
MAYHVFPVLFCLALPYLALPCLALSGLVLPREAPLSPLLFPRAAHPTRRSSRPLYTRFLEPWHTHACVKATPQRLRLFPRFSLSRTFGAPSVDVSICSGACASFLGHLGFQQTRSQHFCGVAAVSMATIPR